ncbi:MAG: DUF1569 domain-containing protein [Leptospirales bacterium]|nr:DUF1569 domain-containing protein [Leptospirales bacterium]
MDRRDLHFTSYAEISAEIQRLSKGYARAGKWSLGQICKHLSYYFRGSLEGFPAMLPWIIRATVGRLALKGMLKGEKRKAGSPTAPASVYPPDIDEPQSVGEVLVLLDRLEKTQAQLYPSALFGDLTNTQWKILHLNHAAHHLGFLHPRKFS